MANLGDELPESQLETNKGDIIRHCLKMANNDLITSPVETERQSGGTLAFLTPFKVWATSELSALVLAAGEMVWMCGTLGDNPTAMPQVLQQSC